MAKSKNLPVSWIGKRVMERETYATYRVLYIIENNKYFCQRIKLRYRRKYDKYDDFKTFLKVEVKLIRPPFKSIKYNLKKMKKVNEEYLENNMLNEKN